MNLYLSQILIEGQKRNSSKNRQIHMYLYFIFQCRGCWWRSLRNWYSELLKTFFLNKVSFFIVYLKWCTSSSICPLAPIIHYTLHHSTCSYFVVAHFLNGIRSHWYTYPLYLIQHWLLRYATANCGCSQTCVVSHIRTWSTDFACTMSSISCLSRAASFWTTKFKATHDWTTMKYVAGKIRP